MKLIHKICVYALFLTHIVICSEPPGRDFFINLLKNYTNFGTLDVSTKSARTKEDIRLWVEFARKNQNALNQISCEVGVQRDALIDILAIVESELKSCTVVTKPQAHIPAADQPVRQQIVTQPVSQPVVQPVPVTQPKGLHNASANCFMNSALQAMFSLDYLSQIVLKNTANAYSKDTMAYNYVTLLSALRQAPAAQYDPSPFCVSARAIMHEPSVGDANEFITILLQSLVNESIKPSNEIRNLFAIETFKFVNGAKHSENVDYILNIQNVNRNTLSACLGDYFSPELVGNKTHQIRLSGTGRYFIVGIKRTGFDKASKQAVKIETPIIFPVTNLNLNDYKVGKQALPYYQLKAVVMHQGPVNAGHYTAYVRNGQQWYFTDDAKITQVSSKQIEELANTGKIGNLLPVTFFYETH